MGDDRFSNGLEDRVVAALHCRGLIRRDGSRHRAAIIGMASVVLIVVTSLLAFRLVESAPTPGTNPNYMLALYASPAYVAEAAGTRPVRSQEYADWARSRSSSRISVVGGAELGETVSVLGAPIHPHSEFAGYFLVRANSLEDAVALARSSPHLRYGGTIAVYEIVG